MDVWYSSQDVQPGGEMMDEKLNVEIPDQHLIPAGEILAGQVDFDELLAELRIWDDMYGWLRPPYFLR